MDATSQKERSRAYYDDFSTGYERERHHGYHALLDELELAIALPYARGRDALEVGCGTGLILERVAAQASHATGVDLSPGMLELARKRGLDAYAISGKHDDLKRELSKGRPVVLGLQLPFEQDRALHHYEVAVAINSRDGSVVTLDPATGKYLQRTRAVLEKEWKPVGFPTLVVVGTADAPK